MSAPREHPSSVERSVWISRPDLLRLASGGVHLRAAGHPAAAAAIGRLILRWKDAVTTERFVSIDEVDAEVARRLEDELGNVTRLDDGRGRR